MKPKKAVPAEKKEDFGGYEMSDVVFVGSGGKVGRFITNNVSCGLYFSPDNARDCGLEKVVQVIVGYNEKTEEIILKPCDAEAYGSVLVKHDANKSGARSVGIFHVQKRFRKFAKRYSYRLQGNLIVLSPEKIEGRADE